MGIRRIIPLQLFRMDGFCASKKYFLFAVNGGIAMKNNP